MHNQALSKVITKAWQDSQFKEKLIKNPKETLKKEGIEFSGNIIVCENTDKEFYFVIPQKPQGEFSEQQLQEIAAGGKGQGIGRVRRDDEDRFGHEMR